MALIRGLLLGLSSVILMLLYLWRRLTRPELPLEFMIANREFSLCPQSFLMSRTVSLDLNPSSLYMGHEGPVKLLQISSLTHPLEADRYGFPPWYGPPIIPVPKGAMSHGHHRHHYLVSDWPPVPGESQTEFIGGSRETSGHMVEYTSRTTAPLVFVGQSGLPSLLFDSVFG